MLKITETGWRSPHFSPGYCGNSVVSASILRAHPVALEVCHLASVGISAYKVRLRISAFKVRLRIYAFKVRLMISARKSKIKDLCIQSKVNDFWVQAKINDFCPQSKVKDFCPQSKVKHFCVRIKVKDFCVRIKVKDFCIQSKVLSRSILGLRKKVTRSSPRYKKVTRSQWVSFTNLKALCPGLSYKERPEEI